MISDTRTAEPDRSARVSAVDRAWQWLVKAMQDTRFCVVTTFILCTSIAAGLTLLCGIPAPRIHDEFSYLLGADTFASGRWTNPTHSFWQHFETFHVIHQPSYASKYPPAQSLTLAIGQMLGHPIVGVWLVTGISLAGLVWMLIGWLPRSSHWFIVVYAAFHPLFQIVWGQSYWGGGIQLLGASLLLGAFIRFDAHPRLCHALTAAAGVLLLANSRPWEGAVLTATVAVAFAWRWMFKPEWQSASFLLRFIAPASLLLATGVSCMLAYNRAVSGDPLMMPYMIHERTYGWNPVFLWEKPGEKPYYRHAVMERFFEEDKLKTEQSFRTLGSTIRIKAQAAYRMCLLMCGATALISLLGLPWALSKYRYRLAFALAAPALLASLVTPWAWPHYAAPAAPLLLTLMFAGLVEIWHSARRAPVLRWAFLSVILLSHASWWSSTLDAFSESQKSTWARHRVAITQLLLEREGRDLVFVRYQDGHMLNAEWVHNASHIDDAPIVWAREISDEARQGLMDYFHDRHVWVVEADATPPRLTPFSPTDDAYNSRTILVAE